MPELASILVSLFFAFQPMPPQQIPTALPTCVDATPYPTPTPYGGNEGLPTVDACVLTPTITCVPPIPTGTPTPTPTPGTPTPTPTPGPPVTDGGFEACTTNYTWVSPWFRSGPDWQGAGCYTLPHSGTWGTLDNPNRTTRTKTCQDVSLSAGELDTNWWALYWCTACWGHSTFDLRNSGGGNIVASCSSSGIDGSSWTIATCSVNVPSPGTYSVCWGGTDGEQVKSWLPFGAPWMIDDVELSGLGSSPPPSPTPTPTPTGPTPTVTPTPTEYPIATPYVCLPTGCSGGVCPTPPIVWTPGECYTLLPQSDPFTITVPLFDPITIPGIPGAGVCVMWMQWTYEMFGVRGWDILTIVCVLVIITVVYRAFRG